MQICIVDGDEMREHVSPVVNFPRAWVDELDKIFTTTVCCFKALDQPHPTKVSALVVPFPSNDKQVQGVRQASMGVSKQVPASMGVLKNTGRRLETPM